MGLNDNINKISRDLTETTKRQLTAAEQKAKDIETKENIKAIFIDQIGSIIENIDNLQNLETLTTNLLKNKNYNIKIIENNYKDLYNKKLSKKHIDYISRNYLKWILEEEKEKRYILKIKEKEQKATDKKIDHIIKELDKPQKITAAETWATFYKIIKAIILILIIPIVFIGSIILECCKTSSKRKR